MNAEKKPIKMSFGTHDGAFHADEVTAAALLIIFSKIDKKKIIRTRDLQKLAECEYVCDVGGVYEPSQKRFDHHQSNYKGNLSSAGMILTYLKDTKTINEDIYKLLGESLIWGIDAQDNGNFLQIEGYCTFSDLIENFVPIEYEAPDEVMNTAFMEALNLVIGHISRMIAKFQYNEQYKEIVQKCMENSKEVLIFDKSLPWMDNFFDLGGEDHPALFVIMPIGNHWKLRGIPPNKSEKMRVRYPLPEEWGGLMNSELVRKSGIPGAIFCHKGRFISFWKTKKDALMALEYTLKRGSK